MQFVGQMSSDDMATLFSNGRRRTVAVPSIGKPATSDENASNGFEWIYALGKDSSTNYGFRNKFNSDAKNCYPTGYPCESTVGATFNIELAYLVGQALGEDALWSGASGLYGFGLGMQRNPYHGRTGEYYSDDPFLTGIMGGYASKGAQEKGLYVYNKHFVLNDQETNRGGFSAWLDEQTFRQIYLRPFEMAIEIGDAMNVMIAFNKLGSAWTGSSYNLMTRWLRGEAGMAGFAVSDWAPSDGEQLGYGILAGSNLLDGPAAGYSAGCDARYDNRLDTDSVHDGKQQRYELHRRRRAHLHIRPAVVRDERRSCASRYDNGVRAVRFERGIRRRHDRLGRRRRVYVQKKFDAVRGKQNRDL